MRSARGRLSGGAGRRLCRSSVSRYGLATARCGLVGVTSSIDGAPDAPSLSTSVVSSSFADAPRGDRWGTGNGEVPAPASPGRRVRVEPISGARRPVAPVLSVTTVAAPRGGAWEEARMNGGGAEGASAITQRHQNTGSMGSCGAGAAVLWRPQLSLPGADVFMTAPLWRVLWRRNWCACTKAFCACPHPAATPLDAIRCGRVALGASVALCRCCACALYRPSAHLLHDVVLSVAFSSRPVDNCTAHCHYRQLLAHADAPRRHHHCRPSVSALPRVRPSVLRRGAAGGTEQPHSSTVRSPLSPLQACASHVCRCAPPLLPAVSARGFACPSVRTAT